MKIFTFSDFHDGLPTTRGIEPLPWRFDAFASRIAEVSPDVIISVGDHTFFGKIDEAFFEILRQEAGRGARVCFVLGNHEQGIDARKFIEKVPGATDLGGKVEVIDEVAIYGFDTFHGNRRDWLLYQEAEIDRMTRLVAESAARIRVLVSHDSPEEYVPGWRKPVAVGDPLVSRLMHATRPHILLCGHYHHRDGRPHEMRLETTYGPVRIVNAGPTGTVIEIGNQ